MDSEVGPAIKEESKVAIRELVDHQACSLLQYINVITNSVEKIRIRI